MKNKQRQTFRAQEMFFLLWIIVIIFLFLTSGSLPLISPYSAGFRFIVTLNLASFLLFGIDKMMARAKLMRVPEKLLHASAFLGGPFGALMAIFFFRHKTRKQDFQLILTLLIILEFGLIYFLLFGQ